MLSLVNALNDGVISELSGVIPAPLGVSDSEAKLKTATSKLIKHSTSYVMMFLLQNRGLVCCFCMQTSSALI